MPLAAIRSGSGARPTLSAGRPSHSPTPSGCWRPLADWGRRLRTGAIETMRRGEVWSRDPRRRSPGVAGDARPGGRSDRISRRGSADAHPRQARTRPPDAARCDRLLGWAGCDVVQAALAHPRGDRFLAGQPAPRAAGMPARGFTDRGRGEPALGERSPSGCEAGSGRPDHPARERGSTCHVSHRPRSTGWRSRWRR
jgi:hypothetical protein